MATIVILTSSLQNLMDCVEPGESVTLTFIQRDYGDNLIDYYQVDGPQEVIDAYLEGISKE